MKILVRTLNEITFQSLLDQLDNICSRLERESGNYDDPNSKCVTNQIKVFFHGQLPVTLLEMLIGNELKRKEKYDYDPRLKWTILMQPCIRSLGKFDKCEGLFWDFQYNTIYKHHTTFCDDETFWCEHVRKMPLLQLIELPIKATNILLDVISRACSTQLHSLNLYCFIGVTDEGFKCLERCKKLERIDSSLSTKLISQKAISSLLCSCPNLKFIFGNNHMGRLLNDMIKNEVSILPLKLTHYAESIITNVSIKTIEVMCPNLFQIRLKNSRSLFNIFGTDVKISGNLSNSILFDLAYSNLQLEIISLSHFPYDSAFKCFFEKKGRGFSNVSFFGREINVNPEFLTFIGKKCSKIRRLSLFQTSFQSKPSALSHPQITPGNSNFDLFSELRTLFLSGDDYNMKFIVNFILSKANGVRYIRLISTHTRELDIDEEFAQLLQLNKLHNLESLWLFDVKVSLDTSRKLLHQLPRFSSYFSTCAKDVSILSKEFKGFNFHICSKEGNFLQF